MNYPGVVYRQNLIEFCRDKLMQSNMMQMSIVPAMEGHESGRCVLPEPDFRALDQQYSTHIGYQKAMRDIAEWAKENING